MGAGGGAQQSTEREYSMYGDNWQEKPTTLPGSPQLPLPDDFAAQYPTLARALCGEHGDGTKTRPSIPPATLFVSASPYGLAVTVSPRDYPQVGIITIVGDFTTFLEQLDRALAEDHIAWKERYKPSPRRS